MKRYQLHTTVSDTTAIIDFHHKLLLNPILSNMLTMLNGGSQIHVVNIFPFYTKKMIRLSILVILRLQIDLPEELIALA